MEIARIPRLKIPICRVTYGIADPGINAQEEFWQIPSRKTRIDLTGPNQPGYLQHFTKLKNFMPAK